MAKLSKTLRINFLNKEKVSWFTISLNKINKILEFLKVYGQMIKNQVKDFKNF